MQVQTHWQREFDYELNPIPNLLFMRDPAAVVGDGYRVNAMATHARQREPLILSYVFKHHPRFRHMTENDKWFDQVTPLIKGEIKVPVSLEGGDILVLSDKVLAVGVTQSETFAHAAAIAAAQGANTHARQWADDLHPGRPCARACRGVIRH